METVTIPEIIKQKMITLIKTLGYHSMAEDCLTGKFSFSKTFKIIALWEKGGPKQKIAETAYMVTSQNNF